MVFVLGKNESALFIMLSESDVAAMRQGNTKFVDHHQLGADHFTKAIVSLHPSDTATLRMLKDAGHDVGNLVHAEPQEGEKRCAGCQGIMEAETLFEEKCIVCWSALAKKLQLGSN